MGGRPPENPDEEVLQIILLSSAPIVTSGDISEQLDMTQQGAYNRLKSLEEKGYLKSRKIGAAARVWWLTEEGKEAASSY